ncbi:unnamed protein product [Trichogramma brassicae]|uniref:Integrase catalytic domain-containing protein n=1 Tax=Trichogramma brassicae TaxID=86971 RepID=A0A6H5IXE4_9HYME|nr:unnamed protein product [Trichogramma brassicae]
MEKLSVWTARALDNIKPAQTGAATPTVQFSTTATSLPKLTLPKFSGLQHEWDTFKALFTSMVKDAPTLTPTLKLQHLFACVEGDALRTIKSIEVTGDNFDVAWTALSRRYENKRCELVSNSTSTHVATGAAVASHTSTNERATILGTAQVRAVNSRGEELLVRALIDPASEGSFVTEHVAQMLALPKKSTPLSVSGVGGQVSAKTKASVSMTLYSTNSFNASISLTAAVLPKVSTLLPKRAIDDTRWPHLKGLALADPHYDTPAPVDCLIGAELYPEIVKAGLRKGPIGSPMAYDSIFGWIVTGPTDIQRAHPDVIGSFKLTVVPMESISCELRKFWELEEMQLSPTLTPAEEQCEDYFHSTHRRDETGRFVVRLPLTNTPELPGSYVIAKQRFLSLERRLAKSPELGQQYNKFMQDYEDLHHMRKASPAQSNVKTAYIPHHAVVGKKLRVVFNASQEANNGKSLNDFLHVGGKLQSDISTIILRWRLGRYAFTADIVKMYRQIRIHDEDVPWQRILWRKNPEDPIQEYELLTVTYGTRVCALSRLTSDASTGYRQAGSAPDRLEDITRKYQGGTGLKRTRELSIRCWTDSQVVLAWLRAPPCTWKVFVANRVSEIHSLLPTASWGHVTSKENPADVASRGCPPGHIKNDLLWWHGPSWLLSSRTSPTTEGMEPSTELERRTERRCFATTKEDNIETVLDRFSSLNRLVRVIAYCLRWKRYLSPSKKVSLSTNVSAIEFAEARKAICRAVQAVSFSEELKALSKSKDLPRGSPLRRLRPFLDDQAILRVGGRLDYSALSFNEKHPMIIPKASRFTELLIYQAHQMTLHGGPQLVQSHLCRCWWIIQGRSSIRQLIQSCPTCARYQGRRQEQLMAPLPAPRVTPSRPFTETGLDYAGPFALRTSKGRGQKSFKGYVAVFTCFSTRAIHLEVVSDYTSKTFLLALRRFFARRGLSRRITTDCGTTFQGAAANELQQLFRSASTFSNEVAAALAQNEVQWDFIPPRAPHFGGIWEAGVKAFKFHLKRVIGEAKLTFEEFSTLTAQIEACLNSRPISPLSADSQDVAALTPGHFLIGTALLAAPEPATDERLVGVPRWKIATQMRNHFWRRWQREVLNHMQVRQKWNIRQPGLLPGELVLITDDLQPPQRWPLARVEQLHPGADGLTRVVTLRTANTSLKRPITKDLITEIHQLYGHVGPRKVTAMILEDFYWPNLIKQVSKILKTCDSCQRNKVCMQPIEGPTQPMLPTRPNELLSIDFIGPFPAGIRDYRYVLVTVDVFTKLTQLYPIVNATCHITFNRIVDDYFKRFGKVEKIQSDRGSQFTSKTWQAAMKNQGVQVIFSAIRHPQSNIVERYNKEIGRFLRTLVGQNHQTWSVWCSLIAEVINSTVNETTVMKKYSRKQENKCSGLEMPEQIDTTDM